MIEQSNSISGDAEQASRRAFKTIDIEELRERIAYDPQSGEFWWRASPSKKIKKGDRAGHFDANGYRVIGLNGRQYLAHRLAFAIMMGRWPKRFLDHRNRKRGDNRWRNLREADDSSNQINRRLQKSNTLGVKGVKRNRRKFESRLWVNGKQRYLGLFATLEEAAKAYQTAAAEEFGEFALQAKFGDGE